MVSPRLCLALYHQRGAASGRSNSDIPALCAVVQGLVIHFGMGDRYSAELAARRQEARLRAVVPVVARIRELDPAPLAHARPPARRLVGSCRASTVLLCAFLRAGVPARARCGFSAYFADRFAGDHWVDEYWQAAERRWVLIDAELDDLLRAEHRIAFDLCDVPRDQWISAGQAWQGCRAGTEDPAGSRAVRPRPIHNGAVVHPRPARARPRRHAPSGARERHAARGVVAAAVGRRMTRRLR